MLSLDSMLERKLNVVKYSNVKPTLKMKEQFVSSTPLKIAVLKETVGIITQCHFLSPLILLNVKTLLDILMVQITNIKQFQV